ncbi:hypothetical protein ACFWIN_38180 [Streptomyces sp. NPDC127049]|uniref:hypothetical protein n=1 Tax=unclassified Streptomyces TaxID=2593676 RepID=UPI0035D86EC6
MSDRGNVPERFAALWETPTAPPRWVIWHTGADETMVFDRHANLPVDVDDRLLPEVLRRMRTAGAPETDDYPGGPCG